MQYEAILYSFTLPIRKLIRELLDFLEKQKEIYCPWTWFWYSIFKISRCSMRCCIQRKRLILVLGLHEYTYAWFHWLYKDVVLLWCGFLVNAWAVWLEASCAWYRTIYHCIKSIAFDSRLYNEKFLLRTRSVSV